MTVGKIILLLILIIMAIVTLRMGVDVVINHWKRGERLYAIWISGCVILAAHAELTVIYEELTR